jgi:hypothetical protein
MKYLRDSGDNENTATEAKGTSIGHELDIRLRRISTNWRVQVSDCGERERVGFTIWQEHILVAIDWLYLIP